MHACALRADATLACWGLNDHHQASAHAVQTVDLPTLVPGLVDVVQVAVGRAHSCALTRSASVACWGANDAGQLGDGTFADRSSPVQVTGLSKARAIAAGDRHTCAILEDGSAACWGSNALGESGGHVSTPLTSNVGPVRVGEDSSVPVRIAAPHNLAQLALGSHASCARQNDGAVLCWGGQRFDPHPRLVDGLSNVVDLAAAGSQVCGVTLQGSLLCWGSNAYGQLGDGTERDRSRPGAVARLSGATRVAVGKEHACALAGGAVWCWGWNGSGKLGNGTKQPNRAPVLVRW